MSAVAKTALVGDLVLLALISVGRIVRHRRRTGDSGVRLGARSIVARVGGALFVVAIVLGVAGLFLGALDDRSSTATPVVAAVGVLIALGGAVCTIWAQQAMGDSWRIGVDPSETPELVAAGPFRWVRNPIFTAMAATQIGLAVTVPSVWTVVAAVVFVVSIEIQVRRVEEPHLTRSVAGWPGYAQRVGRFVPSVGRMEAVS